MKQETMNFDCPMAAKCKAMTSKPFSGIFFMIPGLVLIGIGVLVLVQPQILVWLVASLMIMMGLGVLFMANEMRKFSDRADNENIQ